MIAVLRTIPSIHYVKRVWGNHVNRIGPYRDAANRIADRVVRDEIGACRACVVDRNCLEGIADLVVLNHVVTGAHELNANRKRVRGNDVGRGRDTSAVDRIDPGFDPADRVAGNCRWARRILQVDTEIGNLTLDDRVGTDRGVHRRGEVDAVDAVVNAVVGDLEVFCGLAKDRR